MSWHIGIIIIALAIYAILLYGSSIYGFKRSLPLTSFSRKFLYSFSFTTYISAWILFGTTEDGTNQPWNFIPLLLAPILIFIFFHRTLIKILAINHQENITSLPDFIAKRYGNSRLLAAVVSFICLIAFIPYIALQTRATVDMITFFIEQSNLSIITVSYIILAILLCLSFLTIIIAGRQSHIAEHQYKNLLFLSTVSAILKLLALVTVGLTAYYLLYKGISYQGKTFDFAAFIKYLPTTNLNITELVLQTIIIMMAISCLPHLFQTATTNIQKTQDLETTRWIFSLYLLIILFSLVPIIIVGNLLNTHLSTSYWLIALPIYLSSDLLTLFALLGGLAATVGTVVICCFSLSRMIINHILLNNQPNLLSKVSFFQLQTLRWFCIIFILALSTICYFCLSHDSSLTVIGLISFAGVAQLSPAMIGALYWKTANKQGVLAGLIIGVGIWFFALLLPLLLRHSLNSFTTIFFFKWIQDQLPFEISYITLCTILSLIANFITFIMCSVLSKKRVTEHWQATKFISQTLINNSNTFVVKLEDLISLTSRFIGETIALELFKNFAQKREITLEPSSKADSQWIAYTEHLLAEKLGSSTARAMVKSAIEGREMQMEDLMLIVDEASEVLHFNRMLLQGALEHITQGISVIDKSLHLVAWNQRYINLFDYPEGLIQVGRPIADIIYYNAKRGMCGSGSPEEHVVKRLTWLSLGQSHSSERLFPNGRVIEMIGNPMPGGGFVTSFTDITAYRQAEQVLQESNESLEHRVAERTKELSELNMALRDAKINAEQANESKTRFLAAVSHDLMQPLNAARLFSASLSQEHLPTAAKELVNHLESSLHSTEELISDLLDMSRLESGRITPKWQSIALNDIFDTLKTELSALTPPDITFKVHPCNVIVYSDSKLLRRIVQNFLTNAFRYGQGRVVLGIRHLKGQVRIEVWDQGPGIPKNKQKAIFEEFKRLDSHHTRAEKGLGLGLAIADGFSKLLRHPIAVDSWLGKGSVFSVTVPIDPNPSITNTEKTDNTLIAPQPLASTIDILCIDNEESILIGMTTLLSRWGCYTLTARDQSECATVLSSGFKPQLLLVDYHLDDGRTGVELIDWIRKELNDPQLLAIIISADNNPELIEKLQKNKLSYMKKPVKPAQLRALLNLHFGL